MSKRIIPVFAILSLALMLTTSAFGQEKGKRTGAKMNYSGATSKSTNGKSKSARYANQEVGYRKQAGNASATRPQLSLLPYIEQSNLQGNSSQTGTSHAGTQSKRRK